MRLESMGLPGPVHGFPAHADHGSQGVGRPVHGRWRQGSRVEGHMHWNVASRRWGMWTSPEMSAAFRVYTGSSSAACRPADDFLRRTAKTKPIRPVPRRSRELGSGAVPVSPPTEANGRNVGMPVPPPTGPARPPLKALLLPPRYPHRSRRRWCSYPWSPHQYSLRLSRNQLLRCCSG